MKRKSHISSSPCHEPRFTSHSALGKPEIRFVIFTKYPSSVKIKQTEEMYPDFGPRSTSPWTRRHSASGVTAQRTSSATEAPAQRTSSATEAPALRTRSATEAPALRTRSATEAPALRTSSASGVTAQRPNSATGVPALRPIDFRRLDSATWPKNRLKYLKSLIFDKYAHSTPHTSPPIPPPDPIRP
jgi:hypothetical protein